MGERTVGGRYQLQEPLGDASWRALDTELGREVLVRFRPPGPAATLSHPNIRRVFDHGVEEGRAYEVLEYAAGGTLAQRGELPLGAAAALAGALAYAHAQGVTHGAISADAVLFDAEGNAKLAGFTGAGDADADRAALDELLAAYPETAPTAVAAAPPEEATAIRPPPARRRGGLLAAAAAALLLAGLGAAYVATSGGDTAPPATDQLSVPVPSTTAERPTEAGTEEEPEPTTTEPEETTTPATTATRPTTAPATTVPPPPLPTLTTTEPPLPTEPPPVPTDTAPPTTTEQPPG